MLDNIPYNESLFFWFNSLTVEYPFLSDIVVFCSDTFGYFLIFALIVFILSYERTLDAVRVLLAFSFSAALAWGISYGVKFFFPADRPFDVFPETLLLVPTPEDASFPSGHASFYGALAGASLRYHARLGVLIFIGAVALSLARIIAGVHFPIDIVAGLFLGLLLGWGIYSLFRE